MHKHTIDWYRQINLTSDATLAQKRWDTAEAVTKTLTRARVIELLRLFLFPSPTSEFSQQFTSELVGLDAEFPITNNIQELRLMAGMVMVTSFEGSTNNGCAFALGLRAANFPDGRIKAIQPAILTVAEEYLRNEAGRLRPDEFAKDVSADVTEILTAQSKELSEAEAGGDEAKKGAARSAFSELVPRSIANSHRKLTERILQLAEESGLLWWVLSEYSDALQQPVRTLNPEAYAFAAGFEAAQRTMRLPPPPCIGPLLARALQPCKPTDKKLSLADYVKSTEPRWRAAHVKSVNVVDCRDLSPLCAALEKTEELGSAVTALKAMPKLCPGVKAELTLTAAQAAQQFYNELLFLRALEAVKN